MRKKPPDPGNGEDPAALLAKPEVLAQIERTCRRWFRDDNLTDEGYLFVLEGLRRDDFKKLRLYQGGASLRTYLYSCINSLASDFERSRFGRKRFPKVVAELGRWAERVYRLICWKKRSLEAAFHAVRLEGLFAGTWAEFEKVSIPVQNAPCLENPRQVSMTDPQGEVREPPDPKQENPLESLLAKLDHERRLKAAEVIREVTAGLTPADQELVRLVYGSDLTAAAAGRVVGLEGHQARRRLKRLLAKFREALLAEGVREP
jgi:RNA polymerase sigma factor (sigma-70 family)